MSDEEPTVAGRRRRRGSQTAACVDALQRLKALRSGRHSSTEGGAGFQIRMEDLIYDAVDEGEYEALVAKLRGEAEGFIVDNEGLGSGDEGLEEDWSFPGMPLSSEDSDGESERPKRMKNNKNYTDSDELERLSLLWRL